MKKLLLVVAVLVTAYVAVQAFLSFRERPETFVKLDRKHYHQPDASKGVILFLHGLGGEMEGTWRLGQSKPGAPPAPTFMALAAADPELSGFEIWALGYPTKMALDTASLTHVTRAIAEEIDAQLERHNKVIIICHSLGGVVARHAIVRRKIVERPDCWMTFTTLAAELMLNPKSFKVAADRTIDTIVVHHVSAIFWPTDKLLREKNRERVEKFEREHPSAERKFDWRTCKEIFEIYGVSSHYLVDREGRIHRLVAEKDIAFHAGDSRMPDGRKRVNDFSIGIELISSHPDDDPDVRSGKVPAYTEAQYHSLVALVTDIRRRYTIPAANIVGHDSIAPGWKKDPGPMFDWARLRRAVGQQ